MHPVKFEHVEDALGTGGFFELVKLGWGGMGFAFSCVTLYGISRGRLSTFRRGGVYVSIIAKKTRTHQQSDEKFRGSYSNCKDLSNCN